MRGTAQTLLGLLAALLLDVQVLAADGWGGRYISNTVCGLEGSTVELQCTFWHPSTDDGQNIYTTETWWHTETQWPERKQPKDLRLDPRYSGRLRLDCHRNKCKLFIRELRQSDAGNYIFRFVTSRGRGFSVKNGVALSVFDLSVKATSSTLKCDSTCFPVASPSFIWYENGTEINGASTQFHDYSSSLNSYACALRDYEQLASPPVCVLGYTDCYMVVYTSRRMCALKGSTVDIGCSYSSYYQVKSEFWYTDQPQDLTLEDRYKGRVEFPQSSYGQSTLRINNVTESDSAEYRFKFSASTFEWKGRLPGTTLTVAAAQVQVQVTNVRGKRDDVIAQLACHTTCNLEVPWSFCWFVNDQQVGDCESSQTAKPLQITLHPGDYVTCAGESNPLSISPRLYALTAPSVSQSPSGDISKGQRLTLTCTVDPSASCTYRWFKETGNSGHQSVGDKAVLVIKSSDSAEYFCTVANELGEKQSERIKVNVKYPPEDVALKAIPSAVAWEGQSVNLKCISQSNPKANYAFYKDDEPLGREPREFFNFSSISPEDAGSFHCQACNKYGCVNSTKVLLDVICPLKVMTVVCVLAGLLLLFLILVAALLLRKKMAPAAQPNASAEGSGGGPDELVYSTLAFSEPDAIYSNVTRAERRRRSEDRDEGVEYSAVNCRASRPRPEAGADADVCGALYSTVQSKRT
ncbi:sialoadhesin-like isoform X2 [Syngnathus scovelli]|uniref:sialoadhesin-like isoform X2 n=1 Tax=Syngnathus scovelli TaxID=161590 RepID=UPI002110A698|nr:sialoadhesin-like isoform X2 [Syngnathus scovelli]